MKMKSNSNWTKMVFAFLLALTLGMLSGCEQDGPAEEAGEAIDETMEDASDAAEEAVDEAEEEIDDAEDEIEDEID